MSHRGLSRNRLTVTVPRLTGRDLTAIRSAIERMETSIAEDGGAHDLDHGNVATLKRKLHAAERAAMLECRLGLRDLPSPRWMADLAKIEAMNAHYRKYHGIPSRPSRPS